jgi:O-antigen/teichoic acid export membrane protein
MYVNYAFYEKKTKYIAAITIITGVLNVLLNYLLIPKFGYVAAAWTTLISYIVLFLLHYINVKWVIKVKRITNVRIFFRPTLILILLWILHFFLITYIENYILKLILRILIFSLIFVLTYRNFKQKQTTK